MTPRATSDAAAELAAMCAAAGEPVTPRQLERWRQAGLLPSPTRRGLGRGRGSVSTSPDDTTELALAIARTLGRYRDIDEVALVLFAEADPVSEDGLRRAFLSRLTRIDAALSSTDDARDPFDRAEEAAGQGMRRLLRTSAWRRRRRRLKGVAESPDSAFRGLITNLVIGPLGGAITPGGLEEIQQAFGYFESQEDARKLSGTPLPNLNLDELARRLQALRLVDLKETARSASFADFIRARDCMQRLRTHASDLRYLTQRLLGTEGGLGFGELAETGADPRDRAMEALALTSLPADMDGVERYLDGPGAEPERWAAMRRVAASMSIEDVRVFLARKLDDPATPAEQSHRIRCAVDDHFAAHPDDMLLLLGEPEPG